jgi:transposase
MDTLYERVAGLDVHKDTVVSCVRIMADGKTKRECRTFATTTEQLEQLRAWLGECRCTQVAMEATGVYWMPVWRILGEGEFELTVANAAHIKNVPGRKTDMNDAMWIRGPVGLRADQGKLRPERGYPGAARIDADPQAVGARADAACPAD